VDPARARRRQLDGRPLLGGPHIEDTSGGAAAKVDLPNQAATGGGASYAAAGPSYAPNTPEPPPSDESEAIAQEGQRQAPPTPGMSPGVVVPGIPSTGSTNPATFNRGLRRLRTGTSAASATQTPRQPMAGPDQSLKGQARSEDDGDDDE